MQKKSQNNDAIVTVYIPEGFIARFNYHPFQNYQFSGAYSEFGVDPATVIILLCQDIISMENARFTIISLSSRLDKESIESEMQNLHCSQKFLFFRDSPSSSAIKDELILLHGFTPIRVPDNREGIFVDFIRMIKEFSNLENSANQLSTREFSKKLHQFGIKFASKDNSFLFMFHPSQKYINSVSTLNYIYPDDSAVKNEQCDDLIFSNGCWQTVNLRLTDNANHILSSFKKPRSVYSNLRELPSNTRLSTPRINTAVIAEMFAFHECNYVGREVFSATILDFFSIQKSKLAETYLHLLNKIISNPDYKLEEFEFLMGKDNTNLEKEVISCYLIRSSRNFQSVQMDTDDLVFKCAIRTGLRKFAREGGSEKQRFNLMLDDVIRFEQDNVTETNYLTACSNFRTSLSLCQMMCTNDNILWINSLLKAINCFYKAIMEYGDEAEFHNELVYYFESLIYAKKLLANGNMALILLYETVLNLITKNQEKRIVADDISHIASLYFSAINDETIPKVQSRLRISCETFVMDRYYAIFDEQEERQIISTTMAKILSRKYLEELSLLSKTMNEYKDVDLTYILILCEMVKVGVDEISHHLAPLHSLYRNEIINQLYALLQRNLEDVMDSHENLYQDWCNIYAKDAKLGSLLNKISDVVKSIHNFFNLTPPDRIRSVQLIGSWFFLQKVCAEKYNSISPVTHFSLNFQ